MKNRIQSILKTFFRSKTKTLMTILSMAVVFSMVYSLILPAIAVEKTAALEEPGMEIGAASSSGGEASEQSQELNPEPASEQITEQLSEQLSEPAEDAPADSGNDQEASFSAGLNDGKGTEPDTAAQTEPAADRSGSVSDAVFDHESGGKANNHISEPDTNASDINASGASSSDSIYSGEAGEQSAFGGSGALSGSNAGEDIQNTGSLRADFVTGNTSAESEEFSDCDEQNQDIAMPAMTFEDVYKYLDADEEERQIRVFVKAEEGTFPEGTRMVLGDVEDQSALEDAIEKTVKEELSDTARIRQYQAVDISFYNADGIQIEPAKEVEVRMTSDQIKQISNPMLLHIPDRKDDEKDPVADIIRQFKRIDEQEDELVGNENTLKFNASVFSPYIIAEVEGYEDADGNQFEDRYQDASEDLNYDVSDDPDYDNSGDSDYEASEDPDYDTSGDSQIDDLEIVIEDENDNDQPLQFRGVDYTVTLEYNEDAGIPAGAELSVTEISSASRTYQSYIRKTAHALEDTDAADICYARFFDISILSEGEKVQPEAPVTVTIDFDEEIAAGESSTFNAVHFTEDNQTEIITENADVITSDESADVEAVTFEAESFSVYGITYTVDFHWEVDGKTYDFSLPGGGFVSFSQLVEVLKIIGDTNSDTNAVLTLGDVEVSDAARKFVADVESVVFSNPALLDVSRVNADTTVGQIKESRGLECRYSTELTEEQIEASNGTEVESGDWALISLLPFSSEEELTVTMKDGEAFTIHVTDYQICTNVLTADGKNYKITVTYEDDAKIPDGTKLVAEEISFSSDEYLQHLGQAWSEVNREYLEQEQQLRSNIGGLDDGNEGEEIHPVNLDHVRFFDIRLERNGEEVEPEVPVKVEIQYVDGFPVPETENPEAGVVHFHNDDTELIEEIETEEDEDGNLTCFRYMQDGFSDVGTYLGQETIDDDTASVAGRIAYPKLSAMLRASSGPLKDELGEPAASKTLKDNEDGTYTLSLSVTGAAKKKDEQPKANVLFVMDRSSSMSNSDNDIYLPYDGEHKNGTIYYGTNDNGKSYFALNYSNGRYTYNDYMYPYTTHTYSGTVYTRISRLKAEQDAMSILFKDLLENNKDQNGSYTKDNVEISVISFADDRGKMSEGTEYPKNGSANGWTSSDYTGLMEVVNNTNTPSGTNWQDALKYAKEVADAKKVSQPDEPVFVIFLTDGEPTAIYGESGGAYHYNNVGGGFVKAYTPARPDAKAIVDEGYGFYSIFTFNPGEEQTRYLKRLVHYAYTGYDVSDTTTGDFSYLDSSQYVSRYFYNADSPENLASAFDDILSAITTTIAHGNVSIVDGLTTDAMTSTLINGKANGFTYKVTDENSNVLYTVTATGDTDNPSVTFKINGTTYSGSQVVQKEAAGGKKYYSVTVGGKEYRMALADFVDTGEGDEETKELTWDLSPIGTLADKCTYSIEFVVWPNQEAYDYVAALNNGLKDWNKATQTPVYDKDEKLIYYKNGVEDYPSIVLDPDTGIYSVLTNTKQELEYSIVSTTNGVETIEGPYTVDLDTPDPMELKATASALEKIWNIARDPDILAQLLYGDLNNHYSIGFDILRDESKTKYISIGLGWDEKQGKYIWETDDLIYVKWDETEYKYVECASTDEGALPIGTHWANNFSIATGLMLSEARMTDLGLDRSVYPSTTYEGTKYYLLEEGHDYTIDEPDVGYEFDFNAPVYHPMLVDGVLKDVDIENIVRDEHGNVTSFSMTGVNTIDVAEGGRSALTIENTLRGYIHLKKAVVDKDGKLIKSDKTEFSFKVVLTNEDAPFTGDHIPWYGIGGLYYHDDDGNYYQAEERNNSLLIWTENGGPYSAECTSGTFDSSNTTGQTLRFTEDGEIRSVNIKGNQMKASDDGKKVDATPVITQDQILNIANIPEGTEYSITELDKPGYGLVSITSNKTSTQSGATISGEIVTNSNNEIMYTNRKDEADLEIYKVEKSSLDKETKVYLEGAKFTITQMDETGSGNYKLDNSSEETPKPLAYQVDITTGKNGKAAITGLLPGYYEIKETVAPDGYILTSTPEYIKVEQGVIKRLRKMTDNMSTTDIDEGLVTNWPENTDNTGLFRFTAAVGAVDDDPSTDEDETQSVVNATYLVGNTPGAVLPHTGGSGTRIFTILGSVLILGAGILLLRKRRIL